MKKEEKFYFVNYRFLRLFFIIPTMEAIALYSYEANSETELSFNVNDTILVSRNFTVYQTFTFYLFD